MNNIYSKFILYRIFIIALFLNLAACDESNVTLSDDVSFYVELKHPYATDANLLIKDEVKVENHRMNRISESEFKLNLDLKENLNYLFNIKVFSKENPNQVLWVGKATGIDAKRLKVDNVQMRNEFLVLTAEKVSSAEVPSAAFSFIRNKEDIEIGEGVKWLPDGRIPPEVSQYHNYCRLKVSPDGFTVALPWMQAIHIGNDLEQSLVEVDYVKLFIATDTMDSLIYADHYSNNIEYNTYPNGGLYLRFPFFYKEEDYNLPMPAKIQNGSLFIYPDENKDRVFHWWVDRIKIPDNTKYLKVEAMIRIVGSACVQLGLDFWRDLTVEYQGLDVNNTEAGVSDFLFENDNEKWQRLVFTTEEIVEWKD